MKSRKLRSLTLSSFSTTTMLIFIYFLILLRLSSSWDLKGPAEKYWHMRKLGLIGSTKESTHHEAPFDIPASSAAHNNPLQYYHYNHYNFPATYVNHNNRLSFFEKHDRSVAGSSSPSSKESSSEITSSPSPSSSSLTTSLLGGGSHHHHYTRPTPPGCTYKGRKYSHLEEVTTTQPCLNCTCMRGFVSCYRRVCPLLDPPESDDTCYLLKEVGTCCPQLKCGSDDHNLTTSASSLLTNTIIESPVPAASSLTSSVVSHQQQDSISRPSFLSAGGSAANSIDGGSTGRKEESSLFNYIRGRIPSIHPTGGTSIRPPYNYWSRKSTSSTTTMRPQYHPARGTAKPPMLHHSSSLPTSKPSSTTSSNRHFPTKTPSTTPYSARRPQYPTNNYSKRKYGSSTTLSTTTSTTFRPRSFPTSSSGKVSHHHSPFLTSHRPPIHDDGNKKDKDKDYFRLSAILV